MDAGKIMHDENYNNEHKKNDVFKKNLKLMSLQKGYRYQMCVRV
jgi:hypothetical protein